MTNDGNATVNNVEVTDPMEGLTDLTYQWPGNPGELKPGESVTATATYELTAEDIAAGQVENTATANATVGDEPIDPVDSTVIVYPVRGASLDFDKVASFDAEQAHVGDEVTYEFTVSNTGNVTLTDLVVTDPFEGLQWVDEPTINNLAPGDTVTITATYELTQADIDAGMLTNTATVTGEDPDGTPVTGEDTEITDLPQVSALEVVKSSDKETAHAGEIVTYTVTVTNTGTVTLSDVSTVDHLEGFTFSDDVDPQIGVLSPGETVSVTGTYLVTDEDVEAGSVNNVATVSATDPSGDTVHGEDRVEVPTQPTEVEPTPDPDPELTPDPEPEPDKPVPGPVGDLLAKTGVTGAAQLMVMVLVLVALGGLCLMVARRRTEDEA